MTRVCFVGDEDVTLRYELLSRETSREALSTYDLRRPFENSIAVNTVSLGAAIALCNDLQWYVVRFVDTVLVQEPSVSETEWLSRSLAEALRNEDLDPAETGTYLKLYGVEYPADRVGDGRRDRPAERSELDDTIRTVNNGPDSEEQDSTATGDVTRLPPGGADESASETDVRGRLVEPLYVRRTDGEVPTYDLRDVSETVIVRLTETEYAP